MLLAKTPLIAIVDDDAALREALCDLLLAMGLAACEFAGAAELLAAFAPGRFDLVITDIRMPGLDGLELQRRLRAHDPSVPVIVMTSSTDEAIHARALAGGALACLAKPVAEDELLRHVRAALGR